MVWRAPSGARAAWAAAHPGPPIAARPQEHAMSKSRQPEPDEYEPEDDRPWSEEKWEAFMKEGDLRAARFGELLETFIDHPDRDEIVAREMGWDDLADAAAEKKRLGPSFDLDGEDDEEVESWQDESDDVPADGALSAKVDEQREDPAEDADGAGERTDNPFGDDDDDDDGNGPVSAIPAYRLGMQVSRKIWDALKPWGERRADEDDEIGELIGDAMIGVHITCAKLTGGHSMGYDDHSLGGNIVCCKRALEGAEQAIRGLEGLRGKGEVPDELIDSLLPDARRVADAVRERIAELRARVWW
jgi:hypothetical protein